MSKTVEKPQAEVFQFDPSVLDPMTLTTKARTELKILIARRMVAVVDPTSTAVKALNELAVRGYVTRTTDTHGNFCYTLNPGIADQFSSLTLNARRGRQAEPPMDPADVPGPKPGTHAAKYTELWGFVDFIDPETGKPYRTGNLEQAKQYAAYLRSTGEYAHVMILKLGRGAVTILVGDENAGVPTPPPSAERRLAKIQRSVGLTMAQRAELDTTYQTLVNQLDAAEAVIAQADQPLASDDDETDTVDF